MAFEKKFVQMENCTVRKDTSKACLVEVSGEEYWMPFSQLHADSIGQYGETGTLICTAWIANEKGLQGEPYVEPDLDAEADF